MSISLMAAVWKLPDLSPVQKLVLLSIADNANEDTGKCIPSVQTIAAKSCVTERMVFKTLKHLESIGLLRRVERPGRTTQYIVTPEPQFTPEQCSPLNPSSVTPEPQFTPPLNPSSPRTIKEPEENQKTGGAGQTTPPASQPITTTGEKATSKPKSERKKGSARFESFWDLWPDDDKAQRKVDKQGCLRIWERDKLDGEADQILSALAVLRRSDDWTKDGGKFRPQTKTFLNQKRWAGIVAEDDGPDLYVKECINAELIEQGLPPKYKLKPDPSSAAFYAKLMEGAL